ncbi:MAG: prepilin-type N-terminal cleavage/methylation domain-containing protein [Puniceicoccales bacterium]|jgi:prepilin-type N-terminal cleavage/methylation domain-containing protein|nr:prepilin-type N-terminal cleavage/methylation domain-containing protein [Puniceicoccales bacterium]
MNLTKNKSAFSLMEILITIALMAVISGMAVMGFKKVDSSELDPMDALQRAIRMGKYIARSENKEMYLLCNKIEGINVPKYDNRTQGLSSDDEKILSFYNKKDMQNLGKKILTGDKVKDIYTEPCFLIAERLELDKDTNANLNDKFVYKIMKMVDVSEGENGGEVEKIKITKGINPNNFNPKFKVDNDEKISIKISNDGVMQNFKFIYKDAESKDVILSVDPFSGEVSMNSTTST